MKLLDKHARSLFGESGIDPVVAAERRYHSARARSEVPGAFKDYQRRVGLVIPTYSPDGESRGYQLKPEKPRKDKKGKILKYETPGGSKVILDVHPRMREEVRSGAGDLWVTEGIKKADCLTSRGLATIGLVGVWNWQRGGRLLPCWARVRLKGRRIYIVFDADVMVKESVQLALERLVRALEDLGAEVLVVYLPGPEKGVDDHLVAGHTVAELKTLARRFEPEDLGRIRLSRDRRLSAAVEDLERRFWSTEWKGMGGHSARDVYLKLVEAARRHGRVHPEGVRVVKAQGPLALEAKVSSRTLWKSLNRLEARGLCRRDNEGRKPDKTGAFVLRASVSHHGGRDDGEGKVPGDANEYCRGDLHLRAPRLMWSRPAFEPKRGTVAGTRKVRESEPGKPRERVVRLGKIRGAILDVLDANGGYMAIDEIAEALHRKRARDIRRRNLPALEEAGIVAVDGNVVRLCEDWMVRLEASRESGEELEAEELARRRYRDKSRAYHRRHEARRSLSAPSAAGLAAIERSREKREANLAAHEEHQAKARAAELEAKRFAKRFVYDRVKALGRVRLGLLQEILRDAGGSPAYAMPAAMSLGCSVERLPEFENARFVFAPREWVAA
jgi:hypothetical protein